MITLDEVRKVQEECNERFAWHCTYFCTASGTFLRLWSEYQGDIKELALKFLDETKIVEYRVGNNQVLFSAEEPEANLPSSRIQIRTQFLEWWIAKLTKI